jgi:hypothetical protein
MADGELARGLLLRQEAHRDGVAPERRQLQPHLVGPVTQQAIGHLDQAAGAVAHQRVGADRAAMVEIDQDFQPAADDLVRLAALDVGHETDPARIVFVAWIVEALALRKSHRRSLFMCRRRRYCPARCRPFSVGTRSPAGPAGWPGRGSVGETIRRLAALQQDSDPLNLLTAPAAGAGELDIYTSLTYSTQWTSSGTKPRASGT